MLVGGGKLVYINLGFIYICCQKQKLKTKKQNTSAKKRKLHDQDNSVCQFDEVIEVIAGLQHFCWQGFYFLFLKACDVCLLVHGYAMRGPGWPGAWKQWALLDSICDLLSQNEHKVVTAAFQNNYK